MSKTNTVAVVADTGSVLNLLAHTFTNSTTFVRELLQNSRRAGATRITVDVTDEAVVFTDNGCGIDDPSILLSVAKSGWEDAIQKTEAPYGAGFLAALFACETINVRSKDYSLTAQTADLISLKPAEVVREYTDNGMTSIALIKPKQKAQTIINTIHDAARGFPVEIVIKTPTNGQCVPSRAHALDDTWVDIGPGFVQADELVRASGRVGTVYLQGLSCGHLNRASFSTPIHLKSELFRGRMPDREELIDKAEAEEQVNEAARTFLQALCERELAKATTMAEKQAWFVRWAGVDTLKGHKILLSVGFLPASWFSEWDGESQVPPNDLSTDAYEWRRCPKGDIESVIPRQRWEATDFISLEALRSKRIFDSTEGSSEDNLAAAFVAFTGGLYADDQRAKRLVRETMPEQYIEIDSSEIEVRVEGETVRGQLEGDHIWTALFQGQKIVLVDEELGEVEVPELFAVSNSNGCYFTKETPASNIARAVSDYMDDDKYMDVWYDATEEQIEAALALMDNNGPTTHLRNVLKKLGCTATQDLKGKSFTVTFDEKGEPTVVLMEPVTEG